MSSRRATLTIFALTIFAFASAAWCGTPRFRALVFHTTDVEPDHVQFAEDALKLLGKFAVKDNFAFDSSTNWNDLSEENLQRYQLVVWLNDSPRKTQQRLAFRKYMEHGGAWLGFHFAAYNDNDTHWPWYVNFLGGAVFYTNSWPPLPANVVVDDPSHPVTANLPSHFVSPVNEWYVWKPSPRLNQNVDVLLTLDPADYPLGLKDIIESGDVPVVWSNKNYKMIYMNMGHGSKITTSPVQNELIENAVLWLGETASHCNRMSRKVEPQKATGRRVSPNAIIFSPETRKIYAANTNSGTVTAVQGATHIAAEIKVGEAPAAITVNPVTNRVYVANAGGSVSVLDGATNQVITTVDVGALPYVVAANYTANKIYVSKTFSNTVTLVNGSTNQASAMHVNVQADAIAVDQEKNRSYLVNYEDSAMTIIDGATDSARKVRIGNHIWGMAINSRTHKIYLGGTDGAQLTVFSTTTETVRHVSVGEIPCAIAVDQTANRVYVANYESNSVSVLDGRDDAVLATVVVGKHPQAIAADPIAQEVYVANTGSHTITVINTTNDSVAGTVALPSGPFAVAVDTADNIAYVKVLGSADLIAIDGAKLTTKMLAPPRRR
ncbi:MAG TPA: ThuA domain-containing protein [Candidatus Acidoferrum sp.]|nr:ThuA domain-containing protein [Candidatus Acidoferrum sp.]